MSPLIAVLSLLLVQCQGHPQSRIVGGSSAGDGQHPWMAQLKREVSGGQFFCSGSIIHKHWVLTAAHCVGFSLYDITVTVGTNNQFLDGVKYSVDRYVGHSGYNTVHLTFDVGLVRTILPIQFNEKVRPIALPRRNDIVEESSTVVLFSGWGWNNNKEDPYNLQHINLTLYNHAKCQKVYDDLTDTQICTLTKKDEGACVGDSGGPLVINKTIIGIASYVIPCAKGFPDVFTKVYSFLDWIKENTNNEVEIPTDV